MERINIDVDVWNTKMVWSSWNIHGQNSTISISKIRHHTLILAYPCSSHFFNSFISLFFFQLLTLLQCILKNILNLKKIRDMNSYARKAGFRLTLRTIVTITSYASLKPHSIILYFIFCNITFEKLRNIKI